MPDFGKSRGLYLLMPIVVQINRMFGDGLRYTSCCMTDKIG